MSKKIRYDNIVVVDLEMTCDGCVNCMKNICRCSGEVVNYNDYDKEIIEIGLCLLNVKSLRRHNKKSIMVKPTSTTVTAYCTKLTGIKQEDVDDGISLSDACEVLRKSYNTKRRPWASYGYADKYQIDLESDLLGIRNPMSTRHINVKAHFPILMNLNNEVSLKDAMKIVEIDFEGTPHSGMWDAWNTAELLAMIIRGTR